MKTTQVRVDDYTLTVQHGDDATEINIRRAAYKFTFGEWPETAELLEDYTEIIKPQFTVSLDGERIN
jgi:hypothetical protein